MTSTALPGYVLDASVVVANFLERDVHHNKVLPYWTSLERGQCRFHLPMLALVETIGAICRRSSVVDAAAAVRRLRQLTEQGYILQYPLDGQRTQQAMTIALQYRLRGADAVYAALADELQLELLTADNDFMSYPKVINLS